MADSICLSLTSSYNLTHISYLHTDVPSISTACSLLQLVSTNFLSPLTGYGLKSTLSDTRIVASDCSLVPFAWNFSTHAFPLRQCYLWWGDVFLGGTSIWILFINSICLSMSFDWYNESIKMQSYYQGVYINLYHFDLLVLCIFLILMCETTIILWLKTSLQYPL